MINHNCCKQPEFSSRNFYCPKSDVKATEFMQHIAKILSSNQHLDVTQCKFNVKIFNTPRGSGKCIKIINLDSYIRNKIFITQIKKNDNLCSPELSLRR